MHGLMREGWREPALYSTRSVREIAGPLLQPQRPDSNFCMGEGCGMSGRATCGSMLFPGSKSHGAFLPGAEQGAGSLALAVGSQALE